MARAAGSDHETVARILEAIPASVDGVTSATEIATAADLNPGGAAQVNAVLMLLGVFNVLAVQADQNGEPLVKAATPLAHGFIRSLAEYVRGESIILRNWGRTGVTDPPYTESTLLSGPQFLYAMESNRLAQRGSSAAALSEVEIAQAVIKSAAAPGGKAHYLVQYDTRARQYQLIGGHRRHDDPTIKHTIIRELEEELTDFGFNSATDTLAELTRFERSGVSRTYAVLTQYNITIFHLRTRRHRLALGPTDRWVTESELLNGRTTDGKPIIFSAFHDLPDGLAGLEPTVPPTRRNVWRDLVRRHPWEVAGIILAILGLIASLLPLR